MLKSHIHVIWLSHVIKIRDSGLPLSVLSRSLLAAYHHNHFYLLLVSLSPFLSMSSTAKSLKNNSLPFISLTFLLPTVPHVHSVYTTLLHASLFPFFCHLPFKFLKQDFKSLLTPQKSLPIFKYHFETAFLLSLQLICTMQHFVTALIKQ